MRDVAALCAAELTDQGVTAPLILTPVRVWADPAQTRQVLVALIEKAMRYAPGGPLEIGAQFNGSEVVLRCSDSGPGLSYAAVLNAFKPFWRAEKSRTRDKGGSGLGLSVVRAIVRTGRSAQLTGWWRLHHH